MKNERLNCRFCNKQLPSSRLVDVCIRCASPWKRPLRQGEKWTALEFQQTYALKSKRGTNSNNAANRRA